MEHDYDITLTVNGTAVSRRVAARQHLVDFLRDDLELTGSHAGYVEQVGKNIAVQSGLANSQSAFTVTTRKFIAPALYVSWTPIRSLVASSAL